MILATETEHALVRLDELSANPDNPRSDIGDITELAASIHELGLLQPLLVVEIGGEPCGSDGGTYMIVDGHRRYAALQALTYDDEIPVRVVDDNGIASRILIALAAGIHGRPFTPLDEAKAFRALVDLDMTQRQIAERVGCNQSHVSKRLSLLELPDTAAKALADGKINVREAERYARTGSVEPAPRKPAPTTVDVHVMEQTTPVAVLDVETGADEAAKYKGAALEMAAANEKLKDEIERLRARIVELEEQLATARGDLITSDAAIEATQQADTDAVSAAMQAAGDMARSIQADADQITWEAAHEDATSRLPWPPYRTTKAENIVKFLQHTIASIDTVRHVIAYESTHEQRPEILQAAADRLFELS